MLTLLFTLRDSSIEHILAQQQRDAEQRRLCKIWPHRRLTDSEQAAFLTSNLHEAHGYTGEWR